MKLTEELISQASKGAPPSCITNLALPSKELQEISYLRALTNLVRLDLSHNRLQSIKAVSSCRNLKWLSVASNELRSLEGVQTLSNLVVLNCSFNRITSIKEIEGLIGLGALIANVLSKNPISTVGVALEGVCSLNKLSLSNCKLQELGSIKLLVELKELRLAQNNIKNLSKDLAKNIKLQIIDLGSNSLKDLADIEVLSTLPLLRNLNVRGNPFCLQANYQEKLKALLPALQVIDGNTLRDTSRKQQSTNLPNTTKQLEGVEPEGLHTSNRIKEAGKAVKDQTAQTSEDSFDRVKKPEKRRKPEKASRKESVEAVGIQEQTPEYRKERSQKPKKHAKHEDASKDEDKSVQEMIQNTSIKKGSRHSASYDNDSEPFLEYIGQDKPNKDASKQIPGRHSQKKEDSGVVLIKNNQSKAVKQKTSRHTAKTSPVFSISMEEVEVGGGGKSSWE